MTSSLYELRHYVARPGTFDVMLDRWVEYHATIYADFHVVLGAFVVHRDDDGAPSGLGLLLQHDDRAAVDKSMAALIASDRMNQVPGPPGTTYVDHWERTFLHPLDVSGLGPTAASTDGTSSYELRTYLAEDDRLEELMEQWTLGDGSVLAPVEGVVAAFVSQPEKYEPDGVALLLRRGDARASASAASPSAPDVSDVSDQVRRLMLVPTSFSNMR